MIELIALDFWEDFSVVVLILSFFGLYKQLSGDFIKNKILALIVTTIVIMLVAVPYAWFRYLLFAIVFMYGFFNAFGKGDED
ncbi:hypothetical protein HY993_01145 [Candidatus Micrarchaeota archaeon]|nr:hypothetical protein [Candidatus Micrarchaeota archaeon]